MLLLSVQKVSKQVTNRYKPFASVLCVYTHYPLEFDLCLCIVWCVSECVGVISCVKDSSKHTTLAYIAAMTTLLSPSDTCARGIILQRSMRTVAVLY